MCYGLKNAAHLNGKIGCVMSRDKKTGRCEVRFDDKSLKPVLVKQENLRIVFDLPVARSYYYCLLKPKTKCIFVQILSAVFDECLSCTSRDVLCPNYIKLLSFMSCIRKNTFCNTVYPLTTQHSKNIYMIKKTLIP